MNCLTVPAQLCVKQKEQQEYSRVGAVPGLGKALSVGVVAVTNSVSWYLYLSGPSRLDTYKISKLVS